MIESIIPEIKYEKQAVERKMENMQENQINGDLQFLSLETMQKHYKQWQCSIKTTQHNSVYYKYLEGNATIEYKNGNQYTGEMKAGFYHGHGQFLWKKSGIKYKGTFNYNKIDGFGQFLYPNGCYYKGEVKNGYRHGKGEYINKVDSQQSEQTAIHEQYQYNGQWKNGKRQGKGKLQYLRTNSYFQGYWKNDLREGHGKVVYNSGNQYQGDFKADIKEGKGTMNWFSDHQKYIGEWHMNKPHGYGQYYWYENKTQFKTLKNCYKGQWQNGERSGFGVFYYANGCRYEGQFKNNCKNGLGVITDQYGSLKLVEYIDNRLIQIPQNLENKTHKHNRSIMKSKDSQSTDKKPIKLSKKAHKIQPSQFDLNNTINNNNNTEPMHVISFENKPVQNQYQKYIDFAYPNLKFTENFYNFLLRFNSRFSALYKSISVSQECKQFYTGMLLENYWKAIRESRLLGANNIDSSSSTKNGHNNNNQHILSLVDIDRAFRKGKRSQFDISSMPEPNIYNVLKINQPIAASREYCEIQWGNFIEKIKNIKLENYSQNDEIAISKIIPKQVIKDIHNPQQIILFRHFICLICHTAYLLSNQNNNEAILKENIQRVVQNLENTGDLTHSNNNKQDKDRLSAHDSFTSIAAQKQLNIPDWTQQIHEALLTTLFKTMYGSSHRKDNTIILKQIYSLFEATNVLKDINEKLVFIERIQRYLNVKGVFSMFGNISKKQVKNLFVNAVTEQENDLKEQKQQPTKSNSGNKYKNKLENIIKLSPYFSTIMNYELNSKQIKQLLFQTLNRKISAGSQQEYKKKYNALIQNIISYINMTLLRKDCQVQYQITRKIIETPKDILKKKMIQQDIRIKKQEEMKRMKQQELIRQKYEDQCMRLEDRDIVSLNDQDSQEEFQSPDYYM